MKEEHAPGTDPHVDWCRAWDGPIPRERWDKAPVTATYPTKRGYSPHSPVPAMKAGELKLRRAKVREAMEYLILRPSATPRERAQIKSWLKELDRIERARPLTTNCGALKVGREAVVWLFEPELAPLGSCPRVTVPWSERFRLSP